MRIIFSVALALVLTRSYAQKDLPAKIETKKPYYLDINSASENAMYDIHDGAMGLIYFDRYGATSEIDLKIYNWKMDLLQTYRLDKVAGVNQYVLNFEILGITLDPSHTIRFEMQDENRTTYKWNARTAVKKPITITPTITTKPVVLNCGKRKPGNSLFEFCATVAGGNGPYTLNWYVLNEAKSDFLYHPKEEILQQKEAISMIRVEKNPSYNVMVLATDACGNIGKAMVSVSCDEKNFKNINTLFLEPDMRAPSTKPSMKN